MNVGDRFQATLDVAVIQVNNGRARLQFKTDTRDNRSVLVWR